MTSPRLELRGFSVCYHGDAGDVVAVDDVDLDVAPGEAVGLFGESGSGKSSLVKAAFGLIPGLQPELRGASVSGEARLDGERLTGLDERSWQRIRGRRVGLVFQQPSQALHPLKTVERQVRDVLQAHRPASRDTQIRRSAKLFAELDLGAEHLEARPYQLSGGQQQRVCLALALAGEPSLLVADEPTAALDQETEKQVLSLVDSLRRRRSLSLLWISHDPAVLEALCERLYVMYAGRMVEVGPAKLLLGRPAHPYLAALLSCRPGHGDGDRRLPTIPGDPPDLLDLPPGCRFAPRCGSEVEDCARQPAADRQGDRTVWCYRPRVPMA